jgi:DNA-binding IclR family transcriptional regulator
MTQLSPAVGRTVAVLNFLAGHHEQAFTLTEIAKSLRMSSATCHNLLAALNEAGYVYRTAGKTYVLGPALARVAKVALGDVSVMQVVRPEMRLLADEYDVVCTAYYLAGEEILVRERSAALSHLGWSTSYLLRLPFHPPMGLAFVAWADRAEFDVWMSRADAPLEGEGLEEVAESLKFLRERRYTFGVRKVPLVDRARAHELQNQRELTDYLMSSLEPGRRYDLAYVTAPVFSRPGVVAFALSLAGFVGPARGSDIAAMGERLRESCDRIGDFIAGRQSP